MTQLEYSRKKIITKEMDRVGSKENVSPEVIRDEIEAGRLVIPANINHKLLDPIGIGRKLTTKINANIGMSSLSSCIDEELDKLDYSIKYGADTVMDLSTGGDLDNVRVSMLERSTIPLGTVPLYQSVAEKDILDITIDDFLTIIERQAKQGVDYMTIHCGILHRMLPLTKKRVMGIVSRGGSLIAKWMKRKDKENPLYEHYDDILDILRAYDVTMSLGDSLRPGCLEDATDDAQIEELKVLGDLTKRAWSKGVQVMVEGPGHVPLDQIKLNMDLQKEHCHGAPFYVLGPLVTDIAPGYDHITSSIGATLAAYHGASFLCYVTPREHLGLPNREDVRAGIISYKIAAHASDIARGIPGAKDRDRKLSEARAKFDWKAQYALSLDPEMAQSMREETLVEDKEFCSMCGPNFCSIKINNENLEKIGH